MRTTPTGSLVRKEPLHRQPGLSVKEEFPERVVLEEDGIPVSQDLGHTPALLLGVGPPGRVLGVRDPVEELRGMLPNKTRQGLQVRTVLLQRDRMEGRLVEEKASIAQPGAKVQTSVRAFRIRPSKYFEAGTKAPPGTTFRPGTELEHRRCELHLFPRRGWHLPPGGQHFLRSLMVSKRRARLTCNHPLVQHNPGGRSVQRRCRS